ncbi:MAG TPA: tRNA guanosine(34) transglycosylase Tgt [Flavobacteriaceae bacterium]|nr:tRNA guanosine(34) transglycosylase Tgt [Flavobacteriaceae bacterium]
MAFELLKEDQETKARAGTFTTGHGTIETPIFMPVGTIGNVKGVHQRELREDINPDIILGNTYHLYLRPQTDVLEAAGGLHKFMSWNRPILTDSGGFQVFSLSDNRKIKEKGVEFRSHIDGSKHLFTPENVMDIQRTIGADIIMAFDECIPYPAEYDYAKKSTDRTHRWLDRCIARLKETEPKYGHQQFLFPIVQGGVYKDLRRQSAEYIGSKDTEGYAIGGVSVGEPTEDIYEISDYVTDILPKEKPRYLMGVGTPANILENISLGVDMFDCVMPTRNGRNGMLFTAEGIINIKNLKWREDFSAIDEMGHTWVDTEYSKAYLRHLFTVNEMLGRQIASIHNLGFYMWLVREARRRILTGDFKSWKTQMIEKLERKL